MASLPRPSRNSISSNPPTSPPPSLPVSKTRQTSTASLERLSYNNNISSTPTSSSPATSSIPTSAKPPRSVNRAVSSAAVSSAQSSSIPASQSPTTSTSQPVKALRKSLSYNSFPRPPAGSRSPSVASVDSTNSITTPRASLTGAGAYSSAPARASLLRSESSRKSTAASPAAINEVAIEDDNEADDSPRGRTRPSSSATQKDKGNVVISVRVRPEKDSRDEATDTGDWVIEGKRSLVSYRGREGGEYYYDNVFTTHDKNSRVYDQGAKRLVRRVMEGYNGTVFAYGMTGTGKTYSMQGTATSPGVIPLAITDIFSYIRETPYREFLLRVSYLEIYNEKIFDLLAVPAGAAPGVQQTDDIKLREDSKGNVYATPLKEEIVQSPTQLLRVISRGDQSRRTFSTQYNTRSSRSHAVVQIVVESRERNAGVGSKVDPKRGSVIPGGVRVSTLSLIDLAGSERAAESKERRTEGAHINKSLLTLGNVISKLSGKRDKQGQPTDKDGKHLPYRDSKLTRLLQPALSGNSLISILCTIQLGASGSSAMAGQHTVETLNTLKFAARARNNIVSHAKRAEEAHAIDASSRALLDRYRLEIVELRKQLEEQKAEKEKPSAEPEEKEEEKAKDEEESDQRHEEQMLEMQLARTALKERIEHLNRLILSSKSIGVNAGRSFSSMSLVNPRTSTMTDKSVRSSASTATLDTRVRELSNRGSVNSMNTVNTGFEEEEDTIGENGDGTATLAAQVKSLQSDLADKNRYIATLEKRLLQARRSSRSRVSMGFSNRMSFSLAEEGGVDALLQSKDAEIAELREKLDDKDRMLSALRSAARKRDTADTSLTGSSGYLPGSDEQTSSPTSAGAELLAFNRESASFRRRSVDGFGANGLSGLSLQGNGRRSSLGQGASSLRNSLITNNTPTNLLLQRGQTSPLSPSREKKNHGVDEMTRMLDDMIRQKMESESNLDHTSLESRKRNSLLSGPNGVRPLVGLSNNTSLGKTNGRNGGSSRPGKDSSKLNGWEPNSNRRRRSSLLDQGPPPGDGSTTRPLPDRPTKVRHNRTDSKDTIQSNGLSTSQFPERTSERGRTSPTTSSTSTPTPTPMTTNTYNSYSNSTAAASQAIEALRPHVSGRRVPPPTPDSSYSSPGKADGAPSADDTSDEEGEVRGIPTESGSFAALVTATREKASAAGSG